MHACMQDNRPTNPPTVNWLALPMLGSLMASSVMRAVIEYFVATGSFGLWFSGVMWLTWTCWALDVGVAVVVIRTLVLALEAPLETED